MYQKYYALKGKPFSLLPDAGFLYLSGPHKRAANFLDYGLVTEAGFVLLTGEVGTGKTTIIRRYLKRVGPDVTLGMITNTGLEQAPLLCWIAQAFGLDVGKEDPVRRYSLFVDFLLEQYAKGRRCILILDEAQNLSVERLEELRMLSNVNNEQDQLLQILLVGQPELLETLKRNELRQFVQRISVHCHLDSLTPADTAAYIRHRLSVVGGTPDLFDDTACAAVHYFTGGVPRLINLLCDQALVYGFSEEQPRINFTIVTEVVQDRSKSGLSAFRPLPLDNPATSLLNELAGILLDIKSRPSPSQAMDAGAAA